MRAIRRDLVRVLVVTALASLSIARVVNATWVVRVDGPDVLADDEAKAVTVDGSGDVIAAGRIERPSGLLGQGDLLVVKFQGTDGAELWRQQISKSELAASEEATSVVVDLCGDVIVAGEFERGEVPGFQPVAMVIKFSGATGTELWRQELELDGLAKAVAVDSSGDVVAVGTVAAPVNFDFTVIKYSGSNGAELWRQAISGTGNGGIALAVTVDGSGNVIAAGDLLNSGTSGDFTVIKFSGGTGDELWRQEISGAENDNDRALAVTVDAAGDVIAVGYIRSGTYKDFSAVKLRGSDGVELWRQQVDGENHFQDEALGVGVDGSGHVIAVGFLENSFADTGIDFTVIKFRGTDGEELWRQEINGTAADAPYDQANAVAVDASGNAIAVGWIQNSDAQEDPRDFVVIKFRGSDGVELWRREIDLVQRHDAANSVALDALANVAAVGYISGESNLVPGKITQDFAAMKLNGSDGVSPIPPHPEAPPCEQPVAPNEEEERCINELNKRGAKVAKAQGKEILGCIQDATKGKLADQTIEECLTSDPMAKVAKAKQKTIDGETARCDVTPDLFATDAATQNATMMQKELDLVHDIFGSDLDETISKQAENPERARCQLAVAKAAKKCMDAKLKEFNKCKKNGLKGKEAPPGADLPFDNRHDLAFCMGHDPKGRIAKACELKLERKVTAKCAGVDTVATVPGCHTADLEELAACVDRIAECQLCLALNTVDNLVRACDPFDDGEFNGTCPVVENNPPGVLGSLTANR